MALEPHQICLVSGIGQAAKLPHYLNCNFFNGLHGRAIPAALGIKAVNTGITTIVVTGDGDCYGEGGNHLIHAFRRNPDITIVVHNNEIYALTKGQMAPTTAEGILTTLPKRNVPYPPLNMLAVAISQHCGFVARAYAGERDHLATLLQQAIKYNGLSLIEIIQPCITWGEHPLDWYKEKIHRLDEDYDASDPTAALKFVMNPKNRLATGILFQMKPRPTFGSWFRGRHTDQPLFKSPFMMIEDMKEILLHFNNKTHLYDD